MLTVVFVMDMIAVILHPSDNQEYWKKKRERNIQLDFDVTKMFKNRGWTVIRIWECELKKKNANVLMKKLSPLLK